MESVSAVVCVLQGIQDVPAPKAAGRPKKRPPNAEEALGVDGDPGPAPVAKRAKCKCRNMTTAPLYPARSHSSHSPNLKCILHRAHDTDSPNP